MILAIDVGNTNIVLGGIQDGKQVFSARIASDRSKTSDQYALDIQGILTMHGVKPGEIEGGILSSVVPYLQTVIPQAVKLLTGLDIMVVGPGIQPWEKTIIGAINKAILDANLGFTPRHEGEILRIVIPPMTEERRKELTKAAHAEDRKRHV